LRARGEGAFGLCVLGEEKLRMGRGEGRDSELDEVDITEAFLLRSAKVGGKVSGETLTESIRVTVLAIEYNNNKIIK
jgi:hypothetical protein